MAAEFVSELHALNRSRPQKHIQGLMQGEAFVLQYIALNRHVVIPGEISAEMNISSARTAATLNHLENKGLVTRRVDSGDRRRVIVELTPEGEAQARGNRQLVIDLISRAFAALGESDAREYVRITARLAELARLNPPTEEND